jgi:cyanate permease
MLAVGASIGPLPLGVAFDLYGTYTTALLVLAVLPVLCSVAILLMRPPRLEAATEGDGGRSPITKTR